MPGCHAQHELAEAGQANLVGMASSRAHAFPILPRLSSLPRIVESGRNGSKRAL